MRLISAAARRSIALSLQACIAIAVLGFCASSATADTFGDIGYYDLQAELGASFPTGAGVPVSQVEAPDGSNHYGPDTSSADFSGKTFTAENGAATYSTHATTVADDFYGNPHGTSPVGVAPGVTQINEWNVNGTTGSNGWVGSSFLKTQSSPVPTSFPPAIETQKIENHSWVGSFNDTYTDTDALLRFDYMINRDKVVAVVAANNGSTMFSLLEQSYNSISVGRSDGGGSSGLTNIDGNGRTKPDIVVSQSATSFATPFVSGSAAVLVSYANTQATAHPTAHWADATNPQTVKAILMAGATTTQFPSWARTTTRPLDSVYGAGQLNLYRSYHVLNAGEQSASSSSLVASQGWDYNTSVNGSNLYFFDVPAGHALSELSVMLNWNFSVTDSDPRSSVFIPVGTLTNLNLKLYNASGFSLGSMIDSSVSTVDNLQHTYFNGGNTTSLHAGRYAIEVSSGAAGVAYGLAWLSNSLLLGDMNGDGVLNNFDISPFELALTNPTAYLATYPSMTKYVAIGDINGDGAFDNFDISAFESLVAGNGAAPVPEPSTLVLMVAGGGLTLFRLRRARCA